jgi:hypothetical protein
MDSNHHGPSGPQGPQPLSPVEYAFGGVQIVQIVGFCGRIGRVWRGGCCHGTGALYYGMVPGCSARARSQLVRGISPPVVYAPPITRKRKRTNPCQVALRLRERAHPEGQSSKSDGKTYASALRLDGRH